MNMNITATETVPSAVLMPMVPQTNKEVAKINMTEMVSEPMTFEGLVSRWNHTAQSSVELVLLRAKIATEAIVLRDQHAETSEAYQSFLSEIHISDSTANKFKQIHECEWFLDESTWLNFPGNFSCMYQLSRLKTKAQFMQAIAKIKFGVDSIDTDVAFKKPEASYNAIVNIVDKIVNPDGKKSATASKKEKGKFKGSGPQEKRTLKKVGSQTSGNAECRSADPATEPQAETQDPARQTTMDNAEATSGVASKMGLAIAPDSSEVQPNEQPDAFAHEDEVSMTLENAILARMSDSKQRAIVGEIEKTLEESLRQYGIKLVFCTIVAPVAKVTA